MLKKYIKSLYHYIEKIGSIILLENFFRKRQLRIIQYFSNDVYSILELGVGTNSYFHKTNRQYKISGFDIFEDSLKLAKEKGVIDNYIVANVIELNNYFGENSFDLVCAFDLIEHLTKKQGNELIKNMEKIARKRIIIYTPNGFQYQPPLLDNPFQQHFSGWEYEEMKKLGFTVQGLNGYKGFKGMYARPKFRPYFIFNFISYLTEIFLHKINKDHLQYAILCYKNLYKN